MTSYMAYRQTYQCIESSTIFATSVLLILYRNHERARPGYIHSIELHS